MRTTATLGCRSKLVITLEQDEDGVWVAECLSIPGCVSQGKNRDEALANISEAIDLVLEVRNDIEDLPDVEAVLENPGHPIPMAEIRKKYRL